MRGGSPSRQVHTAQRQSSLEREAVLQAEADLESLRAMFPNVRAEERGDLNLEFESGLRIWNGGSDVQCDDVAATS